MTGQPPENHMTNETDPLREMARRVARERARANAAEQALAELRRHHSTHYSTGWRGRLITEVNGMRAQRRADADALAEAKDKEKILMRSIARLTDPDWWLATLAEGEPWFDDMRDVFAAAADPSTT